jgi:DNA-binding transcriptional LysR family regulator
MVLDLGSISAAASALGYTQSAVSQQLATLEREVGAVLVDRSQRPLRPTRAGAELRPRIERLLAEATRVEEAVDSLRSGTTRLRLVAFNSALSSFVPQAVRDLRREHAGLVVEVLQLETFEAIGLVRSEEADVAVVHYIPGAAVPDTTALKRRRLMTDRLYAVVPDGHRLARRKTVDLADLEGEPLILPRRGTPAGRFRSLIEQMCAEAGFSPQIAYELEDLPAAQAFVAAGIGLVPMHGLTLATLPRGATARPLGGHAAGSRSIEIVAPPAPAAVVEDLIERLAGAARSYSVTRRLA